MKKVTKNILYANIALAFAIYFGAVLLEPHLKDGFVRASIFVFFLSLMQLAAGLTFSLVSLIISLSPAEPISVIGDISLGFWIAGGMLLVTSFTTCLVAY